MDTTVETTTVVQKGWGFPLRSKKAHYFDGGRSLCGRWMFLGRLEASDRTSPDDCVECSRRLAGTPRPRSPKKPPAPTIPIERFGKDHWSTFAYVEARIVDWGGKIDNTRMRCDPSRHRQHAHIPWPQDYPTRLAGGDLQPKHDDWDCLADLVAAGLLDSVGAKETPRFKLTELGFRVTAALRKHKGSGGQFAQFRWPEP
jgi:hypothetical protein